MLSKKEAIVILSIFAAITVVFASIYLWSTKHGAMLSQQAPQEPPQKIEPPPLQEEQGAERTITGVKIPKAIHAYNGLVHEIGDGYLSIKAASHNNYLVRDQILKIHFNGTTKIYKRILPKAIAPDASFVKAKETAVSKEDISIGDSIIVYSQANIKDSLSFKADIIKILEL